MFRTALLLAIPLIGCWSFHLSVEMTAPSRLVESSRVRQSILPWSSKYLQNVASSGPFRANIIRLDCTTDVGEDHNCCRSNGQYTFANGDPNPAENSVGLYVHIPYCRQRCRYCDFAIVPIGDQGYASTGIEPRSGDDKTRRREDGFQRMNERYVAAVITELKLIAADRRKRKKRGKLPLRSIYFGGGTPSLAPIESIQRILYHACGIDNPDAPFRLLSSDDDNQGPTEITMEMDPGTFDRDHMLSLRRLGINRVSLGVQSFDDDLLSAMGRTHRRVDILNAVRDIAFVFGDEESNDQNDRNTKWYNVNYSIDLISGCPGLTLAKWVETLQEATAGVYSDSTSSLLLASLPPPNHISVYDMQVEEGTVFGKWAEKARVEAIEKKAKGDHVTTSFDETEDDEILFNVPISTDSLSKEQRFLGLPTAEDCAFMYKYTSGYLRTKNYEHYEVSSYAAYNKKSGPFSRTKNDRALNSNGGNSSSQRSRHNQIYWEYDGEWHAVGLGATSHIDKKSVARPRQMSDYIEWVADRELRSNLDHRKKVETESEAENEDVLSDLLLKRLRTSDGLDLKWLEKHYGPEVVKEVLAGANLGLELELAEVTKGEILRLKDPDGLLYSNFIISSIFAELGYTE